MVLVCFVFDLRTLSPPLLRDLSYALLQLANYYAVSTSSTRSRILRDKIGLCYIFRNRITSLDELKIAYSPIGKFSLRDFHHAVGNLPTDAFLPEFKDPGSTCSRDIDLANILHNKALYSWGSEDIVRKLVFLSSCFPKVIDSVSYKTLKEAADECVSIQFLLFEQISSHLSDTPESINNFSSSISDLDNCSFQTYLPDARVLHGLVKQWLQDLKEDLEESESLQAQIVFKSYILGPIKHISCNLTLSVGQITDEFRPCKTCRCHGLPLEDYSRKMTQKALCPVTEHDLGKSDLIQSSVIVGGKTVLFLPSFQSSEPRRVSLPVKLNIIERTTLSCISEGIITGMPYVVVPASCQRMESTFGDIDPSELNTQLFREICHALHTLDQGLICSSNCNIETMMEPALRCYYLLQPSESGLMLLRRLAGSEEVLPVPDVNQLFYSPVNKEIKDAVHTLLSKVEVRDYNPIFHERGFHQKLNLLVKESLHFNSMPPTWKESTCKPNSNHSDSSEVSVNPASAEDVMKEEENPSLNWTIGQEKSSSAMMDEWEQLIVSEAPNKICTPRPKIAQSVVSPSAGSMQMDTKTSKILERLEMPRLFKTKAISPKTVDSNITARAPIKKPLIPIQPNTVPGEFPASSQLMKPNFQRTKRKCR